MLFFLLPLRGRWGGGFKTMNLNFTKSPDGLIPAIIQDAHTQKVLMLGFMNQEAFEKTEQTNKVTFYSRTRKTLWTKGETSGNFLHVVSMADDCDNDTLLIKVRPDGPTCHTGNDTCFNEKNSTASDFLQQLENVIKARKQTPVEGSYTNKLFDKGVNKIAQKVGEEAVELVIERNDRQRRGPAGEIRRNGGRAQRDIQR